MAPLQIDFLFLDLVTCTRCRGTDESLEAALEIVGDRLATSGTEVEVNRIHVASAARARELRLVSSPTIRIDGRDVALDLRESSCGSEACTDGCGESIACRVWVHGGEEHTVPPVAMIVDAILREVDRRADARPQPDGEAYELPENLARFFAGKVPADSTRAVARAQCCSPEEQVSCCAAEAKADCCGEPTGGSCGCR